MSDKPTFPYSDVHFVAHLWLWVTGLGPSYRDLNELQTKFKIPNIVDRDEMLNRAFRLFVEVAEQIMMSKRGDSAFAAQSHIQDRILRIVPDYVIPDFWTGGDVVTLSAPTKIDLNQLIALMTADLRVAFLPPPLETSLQRDVRYTGTISFGDIQNVAEICAQLIVIFNLDSIIQMHRGQWRYFGERTNSNRKLVQEGVFTGFCKDWSSRYQVVFTVRSGRRTIVRVTALSRVPIAHHLHLPTLPPKIQVEEQITVYPRNPVYGLEMMMTVMGWSSMAMLQILGTQLDKAVSTVVSPIIGQTSELSMVFQYDGREISIVKTHKGSPSHLKLALNIAAYLHMMPTMDYPELYNEIVVVTGFVQDVQVIPLREAQALESFIYPSQIFIDGEGVMMITKKKLEKGKVKTKTKKLPKTTIDDMEITTKKKRGVWRFFVGDIKVPAGKSWDTIGGYQHEVLSKPTTTVTRRVSHRDPLNTINTVTSGMSSSGQHSPLYSSQVVKAVNKKGEVSKTAIMPTKTTAVLWVKVSQKHPGILIVVDPSAGTIWYSRKYDTLVVLKQATVKLWETDGSDYFESASYYDDMYPSGTEGVYDMEAQPVPDELDVWYNFEDARITSLTPEAVVKKDWEVVYYRLAVINLPHRPAIAVANLVLDGNQSKPISLARKRDITGAMKLPMLTPVAKPAIDEPEPVPATPFLYNAKITPRKPYRPGVPGSIGLVKYPNKIRGITYVPPSAFSQWSAVALQTQQSYTNAWVKAGKGRNFGKNLFKQLGIYKPEMCEWWCEEGYAVVGQKTYRADTTQFAWTADTVVRPNMLERQYNVDVYVIARSPVKKSTEKRVGVPVERWYIVETAPRLWDSNTDIEADPVFILANVPLSHAHVSGDPFCLAFEMMNMDRALDRAIRKIKRNPPIPKGTAVVVFDDAGLPMEAYNERCELISTGPFTLKRKYVYKHYLKNKSGASETFNPQRTSRQVLSMKTTESDIVVHSRFPKRRNKHGQRIIYYAHQSDVLPRSKGRIYLTNQFQVYFTECAAHTIDKIANATLRSPESSKGLVPIELPANTSYTNHAAAYRKFLRAAGLSLETKRTPPREHAATETIPSILALPTSLCRENWKTTKRHRNQYYEITRKRT